jgi:hypothetical protein
MLSLEDFEPAPPEAFDGVHEGFDDGAVGAGAFKEDPLPDGSLPPGLRTSLPPADLDSLIAYFTNARAHAEQDVQVWLTAFLY